MITTPDALPPVPATTPAWLIKAVAAITAGAGPVLGYVDPGGHLNTPAVRAFIILGFLIVGAAIFVVHFTLAAIHEYGFTRAAYDHIEPQLIEELRTVAPEVGGYYRTADALLTPATRAAVDHDLAAVAAHLDRTGTEPAPAPTVEPPPAPADDPEPAVPVADIPAPAAATPVVEAAPVEADGTITSP